MTNVAARITQADVTRVLRAAKKAGAGAVEVRVDGSIVVFLEEVALPATPSVQPAPEERNIVL